MLFCPDHGKGLVLRSELMVGRATQHPSLDQVTVFLLWKGWPHFVPTFTVLVSRFCPRVLLWAQKDGTCQLHDIPETVERN